MTTDKPAPTRTPTLRELHADLFKGAPEMTLVEQNRLVRAAGREVPPEHDAARGQSSGHYYGGTGPKV